MPFVAAMSAPRSWSTLVMGDPFGTTIAVHSGCEYTSMVRMGDPLARARSAADPAVDPTSTAPARSSSLALFEPADCTQSTFTSDPSRFSTRPWSFTMRLSGL